MTGRTTLPLDLWAQDPSFVQVQARAFHRWPDLWVALERGILISGAGGRGFTAEDVVDRVGRTQLPPNLVGAVLGHWRRAGLLKVIDRQRSIHREAKGRWINRFILVAGRGFGPESSRAMNASSHRTAAGAQGPASAERPTLNATADHVLGQRTDA